MLNEVLFADCFHCGKRIPFETALCDACLNTIIPVSETCSNCGAPLPIHASFCRNCTGEMQYDRLHCCYWYKGALKTLFKEIKFRYHIKGLYLYRDLLTSSFDVEMEKYDAVVPVPSHWTRRFRRFVHPADLLANEISKHYRLPVKHLLKRQRKTEYQWRMSRHGRVNNTKNAFRCDEKVSKLKILLVDDIITTGATLNECARMLKRFGADTVDCFTFARGVYR